MFKSIADEHKSAQIPRRQQMRELEAKIVDGSMPTVSSAVFSELNGGSEKISANQREIEQKCRAVQDEWSKFNRELDDWSKLVARLDGAVKEVGDVRAWSQRIQGEIETVVEQLNGKKQ